MLFHGFSIGFPWFSPLFWLCFPQGIPPTLTCHGAERARLPAAGDKNANSRNSPEDNSIIVYYCPMVITQLDVGYFGVIVYYSHGIIPQL